MSNIDLLGRMLLALILCSVIVSCSEDPLDEEETDIMSYEIGMVTGEAVKIVGCLDVDMEDIPSCQMTVYYSDSLPFDINSAKTQSSVAFDMNQNFSMIIRDLEFGTTYNYCVVAEVNSEKFYGGVCSFTTLQNPYIHQSSLDVSSAIDLSAPLSANCYIVSNPGLYKFKALKGYSDMSVGDIASVVLLWETFGSDEVPDRGELISGVCFNGGSDIAFMTAMSFKEGNAVIAAKDESGKILWSWHIWFTDQPREQKYYNDAGIMMDRNIGATSAKPGEAGSLGLLYQWGRKDPFLNSYSINSQSVAESTVTWPENVSSDSSHGTIEYAIANPTVFIKANDKNHDWLYTGNAATDDTRWTLSWNIKSVYDPCPPGWRVPDGDESGGVWSRALGDSSGYTATYDTVNKGVNLSGAFGPDKTIWYPAAGCRDYFYGTLQYAGSVGHYWSASPYHYSGNGMFTNFAYDLYFGSSGSVQPASNFSLRANAHSVRCQKTM